MSGVEIVMSDVFVQSVTFNDGSIEVQYLDNNNQGEHEKKLEVLALELSPDRPKYLSAFRDLQELLAELVDDAAIYKRNPDLTIPSRQRFGV